MSFLDKAMIVAPCNVSWDTMEGDDRVRHCSGCSKNVYNISDMTAGEAEIFLGQNGERPCLRFYRRPDGKIMTDNCPRALRALRNRMKTAVAIAAGIFSSIMSFLPLPSAAQTTQDKFLNSKPLDAPKGVPKIKPIPEFLQGDYMTVPDAVKCKKTVLIESGCEPTESKPIETMNGDSRAMKLYLEAKSNEKTGKYSVALEKYDEAIKIAELQHLADPAFLRLLNWERSALLRTRNQGGTISHPAQ